MSSSVSAALIVERNLERERQLLRERQAELYRLAEAVRSFCREAREARQRFGSEFPNLLPQDPNLTLADETLMEVDGSITRLREWLVIERRRLQGAVAVREVQQIVANAANSSRKGASDRAREQLVHVSEVLGRLLPDVPVKDVREMAETAAVVVASSDTASFERGLLDLKFKAQRLNERCVQVLAWSQRCQELLDDLQGFNSLGLDSLRNELRRVVAQEVPMRRALPDEVKRLVAVLREQADRNYAATVLAEELLLLGYSVGPEFQTVLARGGELQITHAAMEEYRVEIETEGGHKSFHSVLSREDAGSGQERVNRDKLMQETWCEHLAIAFGRAKGRGVVAQVKHLTKAGAKPVEVSAKEKDGQRKKGHVAPARKRTAEQALKLNGSQE